MCGRYTLTSPIESLRNIFGVDGQAGIPQRYNIAPTQVVLIVRQAEKSSRELAAVEWGLVPEWAKSFPEKPLINARVETAASKPSFRSAVKRQRCLVPFNGWYEWKNEKGIKQPYLIEGTQEDTGAFAGIWSVWHGPDGEHWLETMAILTTEATGPLRSLHRRRPLVIRPQDFDAWLTPTDPLPRGFLESFPWADESEFKARPVSGRVNNIRFDDAACIAPPAEPALPAQGSLF